MRQQGNPKDDNGKVALTPSGESSVGLSNEEAKRRLAAEGRNTLPGAGQRGALAIALEVLREPMFLLLVAGALIYLVLGDVREAAVLGVSIVVVMAITVFYGVLKLRRMQTDYDLRSPPKESK